MRGGMCPWPRCVSGRSRFNVSRNSASRSSRSRSRRGGSKRLTLPGQPLALTDRQAINDAISMADEEEAVQRFKTTLDQHVLAVCAHQPESRVSVEPGPAKPELVEGGTRLFLVKVLNEANVTAPLRVESPNSGDVYLRSDSSPEPKHQLTTREVRDRWATISNLRQAADAAANCRARHPSTSSSRSTAATAVNDRRRSPQRRARHAGCRISERCVDPLHGATRAA